VYLSAAEPYVNISSRPTFQVGLGSHTAHTHTMQSLFLELIEPKAPLFAYGC